jgi:hypothetical protein
MDSPGEGKNLLPNNFLPLDGGGKVGVREVDFAKEGLKRYASRTLGR